MLLMQALKKYNNIKIIVIKGIPLIKISINKIKYNLLLFKLKILSKTVNNKILV